MDLISPILELMTFNNNETTTNNLLCDKSTNNLLLMDYDLKKFCFTNNTFFIAVFLSLMVIFSNKRFQSIFK